MDPGAPQAIPLHLEGDIAVGLNIGRPDGTHRVENHSVSVCPWNPLHGGAGRECGPVLILFRQTALYAAQARTGLCLDFRAHTMMPAFHLPLAIGQPCGTSGTGSGNSSHFSTGRAHFRGFLEDLCTCPSHTDGAFLPLPFDPISLTATSSRSISSCWKEKLPRAN